MPHKEKTFELLEKNNRNLFSLLLLWLHTALAIAVNRFVI